MTHSILKAATIDHHQLLDVVTQLHLLAQGIEKTSDLYSLSHKIRKCADDLSLLIKSTKRLSLEANP